jgi:hypothetical protein
MQTWPIFVAIKCPICDAIFASFNYSMLDPSRFSKMGQLLEIPVRSNLWALPKCWLAILLLSLQSAQTLDGSDCSWRTRHPISLYNRGSISRGHRPIGAKLKRMVIIEGLLMEVVSVVIKHPLNLLYSVVKDELQFRPPNFTQKFLNASEKIFWPGELLPGQYGLHVPEKPEVRRCQVRGVRRMGYSNVIIFSQKFSETFEWWTRQLSRCKRSRRECGLRPSGNTASSSGSKI